MDTFDGLMKSLFRAAVKTLATTHTFLGEIENLPREVYALRVMAPPASEWATFEKDRRSDIRTIMQGITFDGKDVGG
jgi:hypothetical protein